MMKLMSLSLGVGERLTSLFPGHVPTEHFDFNVESVRHNKQACPGLGLGLLGTFFTVHHPELNV